MTSAQPQRPALAGRFGVPAAHGALAALLPVLLLVVPALASWLFGTGVDESWLAAVGVGSALAFLGHGMPISAGAVTVSLTPLLVYLLAIGTTSRRMHSFLLARRNEQREAEWAPAVARDLLPGFFLGYAGVLLVTYLLTFLSAVRVNPLAAIAALHVPALGVLWALWRLYADDEAPDWLAERLDQLPVWVGRAMPAVARGLRWVAIIGAAVILLRLALSLGTMRTLQGQLNAGVVGTIVLLLAQLMLLPNAGLWAWSFFAGPGFAIADSGSITATASHPGLLPLVPALGALPADQSFPKLMWLVLLVPIGLGAYLARMATLDLPRLASLGTRVRPSAGACGLVALALGWLAWIGSGAIGTVRLASVGVSALPFTGVLLLELLVGAAIYLGINELRERR